MLTPRYKSSFKNDLNLMKKRGKDLGKIKRVIHYLIHEIPLPVKHRDHPLRGEFSDCRECHIEPDWLMIYFLKDSAITFVATGTHADLFR